MSQNEEKTAEFKKVIAETKSNLKTLNRSKMLDDILDG